MQKFNWTGKTRGGFWGNYIFYMLLKIGLLPAYALLIFVAAFFQLFRSSLCEGIRIYLSKNLRRKVGRCSFELYKSIFMFGTSIIDRVSYFSGCDKIQIDSDESDAAIRAALSSSGVLLVISHIGGWQILATKLLSFGKRVTTIGVDMEDAKIAELFNSSAKLERPKMIYGDELGFLDSYKALKNGDIVSMHADRYLSGRFVETEFFGEKLRLPSFGYWLARKSGAKIIQVVCVKQSLYKYKSYGFPICAGEEDQKLAEGDFIAKCAGEFAANMEHILRKYPHQWYNFFDFWRQ